MPRLALATLKIQPRNLCIAVMVAGKVVERFYIGKKNRFYREGDCPVNHNFEFQWDSANAFKEGWNNETMKMYKEKRGI